MGSWLSGKRRHTCAILPDMARSKVSFTIGLFGMVPLWCMLVLCSSCGAPSPAEVPIASGEQPVQDSAAAGSAGLIADSPSRGLFWVQASDTRQVESMLQAMSDEQVVAQVFMLGWASQDADGSIMEWIATHGLGGVKIFGWNANDTQRLARTLGAMQARALASPMGIPLLTATDQEGGWVRHVKGDTSLTPGNIAIAAGGIPQDAFKTGYYIAREMRAIGINMNFAPTVDVYTNPKADVIGPRAFSADARQTAILSTAYFHGQEKARVISTAKHFPGHGNATGDSHGVMPVIQDSFETLWDRDLLPYRMLIAEGMPSILSGHLNFPKVSRDGRPASLSPALISDLLIKRMNFKGLVITDDIYMGGASEYGTSQAWDIDEIVYQALKSGNNMVMLSRTPEARGSMFRRILNSYRNEPAFKLQIQESVRRILAVKLQYLKPADRVPLIPDLQAIPAVMNDRESRSFFRDQAYRAVTLVKKQKLPLGRDQYPGLLLVAQDPSFLRIGLEYLPRSRVYQYSFEPFYWASKTVLQEVKAASQGAPLIVFCLTNPNSLEVLQTLEPLKDRVVVISSLTPIYLRQVPWVQDAVAVYGWGIDSYRAGFDALTGLFVPTGIMPVPVQ